jgi:nucleoside 2-deoxyribosyltransferase
MKRLFLIAPYTIDPEYDLKKKIVKDICAGNNFQFSTADQHKEGDTLDTVKTLALFDDIDIFAADLSLERPSCYYEVGYVQALKKRVYLIAQIGTPIHQITGNVTFYSNINEYAAIFRNIFMSG